MYMGAEPGVRLPWKMQWSWMEVVRLTMDLRMPEILSNGICEDTIMCWGWIEDSLEVGRQQW
eukprot:scaffold76105_cov69-Attheya_sp.AAC.2